MKAEASVIGDKHVVKRRVLADIILGQNVIALVTPKLPLRRDEGHPLELKIGKFVRVGFPHVGERAIQRSHQVISHQLPGGVGVQPLAILPEVGGRKFLYEWTH